MCVCARAPQSGGPQGVEHLVKNLHEFHPVAVIDSHPSTEASRCNWKVAAAGARPHRPHAQSWCSSCSVWLREAATQRRAVNTVSDLSRFWSSPAALGCGILLVSVFFSPHQKIYGMSLETTIYRWIKKQLAGLYPTFPSGLLSIHFHPLNPATAPPVQLYSNKKVCRQQTNVASLIRDLLMPVSYQA